MEEATPATWDVEESGELITETTINNNNNTNHPSRASQFKNILLDEQRLLRSILALVILMNIPIIGHYLLYPFTLFSTWVHEMCHGITAILCGGSIEKLMIYHDGSGLAYTSLPLGGLYDAKRVIVASMGYMGTSIVGCILLLFRKTRRAVRIATVTIGLLVLLSTALYVRNPFGFGVLIPMGVGLAAGGYFLSDALVGELYAFLAVTCCLNAVTSINVLFNLSRDEQSDAHTVASYLLLPYWFWALVWLLFSMLMCYLGVLYGFEKPDNEAAATSTAAQQHLSGFDDAEYT